MKKYFPSVVYFCVYPLFQWGNIILKMSKGGGSAKRQKNGGQVVNARGGLNQLSADYDPSKTHRVPLGVIWYDFIKILLTNLQYHQKNCIQDFFYLDPLTVPVFF